MPARCRHLKPPFSVNIRSWWSCYPSFAAQTPVRHRVQSAQALSDRLIRWSRSLTALKIQPCFYGLDRYRPALGILELVGVRIPYKSTRLLISKINPSSCAKPIISDEARQNCSSACAATSTSNAHRTESSNGNRCADTARNVAVRRRHPRRGERR